MRPQLQQTVHEVQSTRVPASGQVLNLDLSPVSKHFGADVSPCLALVGASLEHELVADDSQGVEVGLVAVVLPEDYLRGHVAGSAAGVTTIFANTAFRYAKIGQSKVATLVKNKVFRLQIPMNNIF